jgi:replicative DNA helicase
MEKVTGKKSLAQEKMEERILEDHQAEENVLACLVQRPHTIQRIMDSLQPEHFMGDERARIYKIFVEIARRGKRPSMPMVLAEMKHQNIDVSQVSLINWSDSLATLGSIEDYAELVIKKSTFRQLAHAAQEIVTLAWAEDEDALEKSEQIILDIARGASSEPGGKFGDVLDSFFTSLKAKQENRKKGIYPGLRTGFHGFDRLVGGFMPGNTYVIAALTGGGKTFLAANMSLNIAKAGKRCLFFSLEMTSEELMQRFLARELMVNQTFLRDADLSDAEIKELKERAERIRHYRIEINTTAYYFNDIKQAIRQSHMREALDVVFLDYFQLVQFTQNVKNQMQRAEILATMSREIKILSSQLNIPIVILAQVNRDVEKRSNKEPQLSDLNESGGMARDATGVVFIYSEDTEEVRAQREAGIPFPVLLRVAKSRHGNIGTDSLMFNGAYGIITDPANPSDEEMM